MSLQNKDILIELIKKCMESDDICNRAIMIQYLNRLLPSKYKIQLPSLITNDCIDRKLYLLEENIL